MMVVLSPTYTLRVEIKDRLQQGLTQNQMQGGSPFPPCPYQFYNEPTTIGCDAVLKAVRDALISAGIGGATVTFERFEHKS